MRQVGIGSRVINFLVDTLLISLLALLLSRWYNWYVFYYGFKGRNYAWFFWGTLFVYYAIFEAIFARTPGKLLTYSKVVTATGKKPNVLWILLRSLVRLTLIDLFFQPFLGKTLHDYISKTDVVEV